MITHLCGQTEVRQRRVLITYNNNNNITGAEQKVCVSVCVSSIDARCVNNLISSNTRYMIQDIKTNLALSLSLSMNCEFRLRFEYRICMQPAAATVISMHCE